MQDMRIKAYSQEELDTRVADACKRGYKVKRQGSNFTHWDRSNFFAVLEKDKDKEMVK